MVATFAYDNAPTMFTYGCAVRFADVGGETANMERKGRPDVLPPAAAKHRENVRGMWRGHGSWGRETPGYGNNRLRRKRAGGAGREGAVTNSRSTSFLPASSRPGGFAALG